MNFQRSSKLVFAAFGLLTALFATAASAQLKVLIAPKTTPPVAPEVRRELTVAERNNLYCAGYVQKSGMRTNRKIIGAVDEQDGHLFSQNNFMYINMGADKGVQIGNLLSVIRPRGQVKTRWTDKDDGLGFYVQEVGIVEVVRVKPTISVVRVQTSCDNILMGDLIQPMQPRVSPKYKQRPAMDLFAEPSGKAVGRLFMSRDGADLIQREHIVYIDLGAEDKVNVGDYLTIFRPLGKGNLFVNDTDESVSSRAGGFQSDEYRGGRFSNQSQRESGSFARGKVMTTSDAKGFLRVPVRKVVGEMVILNVKERTATALITRNAQEIHPGDWVEVQ